MATYVLTRSLLFRWAGVVFFAAFLSSYIQNDALMGVTNGLLPADNHLERVSRAFPPSPPSEDVFSSPFEVALWCEVTTGWFSNPRTGTQQQRGKPAAALAKFFFTISDIFWSGRLPAWMMDSSPLLKQLLLSIDGCACAISRQLLSRRRTPETGGLPSWEAWRAAPTLLWFVPTSDSHFFDAVMRNIAVLGMAISAFMMLTGTANFFMALLLYILYGSITAVGTEWFSFGWENQILECALLLAVAAPFFNPVDGGAELGLVPRKLLLWHAVRLFLGAGLIKIRGDSCWRDLSCMQWHYQSQPNPHFASIFYHATPMALHRLETLTNHFVELAVPGLLLLPFPSVVAFGSSVCILFMATIASSGNLAFLNHLAILPLIAGLDDFFLLSLLRSHWLPLFGLRPLLDRWANWLEADVRRRAQRGRQQKGIVAWSVQMVLHGVVVFVVASLSIPAVDNLLLVNQQRQHMNAPHHWTNLVGSYGAFGSITRDRPEIIFQVHDGAAWKTVSIKHKFSGEAEKRQMPPVFITPFHNRFAWLCWFGGFLGINGRTPHFLHFVYQISRNTALDRTTLSAVVEPSGIELLQKLSETASSRRNNRPLRVRVLRQKYKFNVLRGRSEWDVLPFIDVISRFALPEPAKVLARHVAVALYGEAAVERAAAQLKNPAAVWIEDGGEEQLIPPVTHTDGQLKNFVDQITGKNSHNKGRSRGQ